MPTLALQPEPVQWIIGLVPGTLYNGKAAALIAATALSAANANAPVQMAEVWEIDTAASGTAPWQLADVNMAPGPTPAWIVQLANLPTYYPLETARKAAYALSAANAATAVNIARVNMVVTAP